MPSNKIIHKTNIGGPAECPNCGLEIPLGSYIAHRLECPRRPRNIKEMAAENLPPAPTKPVAEMSDEELLRAACGECSECSGTGDDGEGKHFECAGTGAVSVFSNDESFQIADPARIRALVAAERRDEFNRTCKIIAAERIKRLEMSTRNDQGYLEGLSDGFDGAIAAIRVRGGKGE